ncbi:hypothetical protein SAMN05444422_101543 [Halobiforma haloterrestris]|uniref:Uncharacterized protein n=1 Tax=Natronobacterium haloterrestre TaxID=148448 RepID=A0A1I1DK08_NATHA|nr:YkgJ family cysteine cluster protein [Halobiforma haloterrestris]SFB73050.1 hypothetical protein SAMN05444422_101543 [Halobiforma haloterrestris]
MQSLEEELARARDLAVDELADAIESIGFECTRCGACCTGHGEDEHTATVFPDEVRELQAAEVDAEPDHDRDAEPEPDHDRDADADGDREWRDVARPMPYGLREGDAGLEGETFEWALQTDGCGDCVFYEETDGTGACTAHDDRPLICRTYPFSVALAGTSQPMGEAVDSVALEAQREAGDSAEQSSADHSSGLRGGEAASNGTAKPSRGPREEAGDEEGIVRAHECEGLGRDISRDDAEELAAALKERAVRELEEAIAVRDNYTPADPGPGEVVVHDSEGAKGIDGRPLENRDE